MWDTTTRDVFTVTAKQKRRDKSNRHTIAAYYFALLESVFLDLMRWAYLWIGSIKQSDYSIPIVSYTPDRASRTPQFPAMGLWQHLPVEKLCPHGFCIGSCHPILTKNKHSLQWRSYGKPNRRIDQAWVNWVYHHHNSNFECIWTYLLNSVKPNTSGFGYSLSVAWYSPTIFMYEPTTHARTGVRFHCSRGSRSMS